MTPNDNTTIEEARRGGRHDAGEDEEVRKT
jgi:hypothetical protein